jgi:hypothetical protein
MSQLPKVTQLKDSNQCLPAKGQILTGGDGEGCL